MKNADSVFPIAKLVPNVPAVIASIPGSVIGDDNQKAMIGAKGTLAANRPATKGKTDTPQTGVNAPTKEATTNILNYLPI